MSLFKEHLERAHAQWRAFLRPADGAVDMTCGNGHDTLVLAEILKEGWVLALDLQPAAVEATTRRVAPYTNRVRVAQSCHTQLPATERPRLIVYNLGYLPGGDKSLTTRTETTLRSLEQAFHRLAEGGALSIMCYPGHEEGLREETAVVAWARSLAVRARVTFHQWWMRPRSPSWLWIVRGAH